MLKGEASMVTHPRYNLSALNSSSYEGCFPTALSPQHLENFSVTSLQQRALGTD